MTLSLTIIISKLAKLKQDSQDGLQKAILLLPPYYVLRRRSGIRNANCDLVPTLLFGPNLYPKGFVTKQTGPRSYGIEVGGFAFRTQVIKGACCRILLLVLVLFFFFLFFFFFFFVVVVVQLRDHDVSIGLRN